MDRVRRALLALERGFWHGDADFYRENLDDSALMVFPGMAGVFAPEDIAATIKDSARWKDLKIEEKGLLTPAPGFAVFAYEARATRASGQKYKALITSAYVQRDGRWKMLFHQQTPLQD